MLGVTVRETGMRQCWCMMRGWLVTICAGWWFQVTGVAMAYMDSSKNGVDTEGAFKVASG